MSFGTTFADAAAEMEGEEGGEGEGDRLLTGVDPELNESGTTFEHVRRMIDKGRVGASILLDTIESYRTVLSSKQRESLRARVSDRFNRRRVVDPHVEAHAAGKAHAAYADAGAGSYPGPRTMNVVITFTDAARTFAYRGLNALAGKLREIAERIEPIR